MALLIGFAAAVLVILSPLFILLFFDYIGEILSGWGLSEVFTILFVSFCIFSLVRQGVF